LAVKLRLTRMGKKKQPFYRIIAIDSRARRDGKYVEKIGHYNPLTNPAEIVVDEEKTFRWLKNGAIPTDTVKSLLSKKGILLKWNLMKKGLNEAQIDEEYKKWEVLQLERQKREEALAAQAKREEEQIPSKEEKITVEETVPEPPAVVVEIQTESIPPDTGDQAS